ncbi:9105_t:CDS:2 [Cetraspora pellucida]|uniref:9105_t:CDS:1 n=1 Tax=Cetraspora pellucida TaxID=1433469 RepID=A0A9N8Z8C8_9GLOM|nr:9105_t:CDS:2 [Cetraspora pellucida]
MGQSLSSSTNNQDQDGDVIMVDDSETSVEGANGSEYTYNSQTGPTTSLRRPRLQSNVAVSENRTQPPQSSTSTQNGSPRVLRMTPARRRRQLSNLYPFFPSATTSNQTQVPLSRPLTRLQRLHHNSVDDVSLTPRQTDAISPNMIRRSRTRSSSYNGHDADTLNGLDANNSNNRHSLPTVETVFDVRRPRSNSVDVILNGNLDEDMRSSLRVSDRPRRSSTNRGSSSRPYSSYTSLPNASDTSPNSSTAGTQTDSSTASPQRLRRRLTRISARRLFNVGGADSESNNNSNNNIEDNDAENQVLGRLLSMAAAATARSLVESQENAVIEAERAASEGHDGSFESFLAALQRRRREASNRPSNQTSSSTSEEQASSDGNTSNSQSSQPMSFFRLFRFGGPRASSSQQNPTTETMSDQSSSTTVNELPNNESNGPHMVPVIIIGIRSVPPREDPTSTLPQSQQPENNSSTNDTRYSSGNRSTRARSSLASNRNMSGSTASTGTQTPPARSWIIYVLGGTYPSTHPLLTTPSLFSDNPTYEDMVLLSSLIGPARPPTTTQSEIDANLPVALYNESIGGLSEYTLLGNAEKCQVCLCDYVTDEEVRVLNCRHGFHRECIDKWLTEGSNKCPICRGIGVPSRENEVNNNNSIPTTTSGLGPMGPFF